VVREDRGVGVGEGGGLRMRGLCQLKNCRAVIPSKSVYIPRHVPKFDHHTLPVTSATGHGVHTKSNSIHIRLYNVTYALA